MLDRCSLRTVVIALGGIVVALAGASPPPAMAAPTPLEPAQTLLDGADGTQGLDRAWSVVVAPNGSDVYSAAPGDDAVVHWRLASDGRLVPVKVYQGGFEGLEGLDGVFELVLSPDGLFLYAMSEDSLVVFRRQTGAGTLQPIQTLRNDDGGLADLLSGLDDLALSPDGRHLLVVQGGRSASVLQLDRNGTTGLLTIVRDYRDFPDASPGLSRPFSTVTDLDFSPDGRHLYVASVRNGIILFSVADDSGELEVVQGVGREDGVEVPAAVAVSPDGKHVYGTNVFGFDEPSDPGLWAFSRNAETGILTRIGECCESLVLPSPFFGWPELIVSPDGLSLYSTYLEEDALVHLRRDPVSGQVSFAQSYGDDPEGEPKFRGPSDVVVTSDGAHLLLATSDDSALHSFSRSVGTGELSGKRSWRDGEGSLAQGFQETQDGAFSADGRFFYAASFSSDAVTVFAVDAGTGTLSWEQTVGGQRSLASTEFRGPRQFQISPDGRFLFLNRSRTPAQVFAIDPSSGHLTLAREADFPVRTAVFKWLMAPSGLRLYAMNQLQLLTLEVDPATGAVEVIQDLQEVRPPSSGFLESLTPNDILLSPDGRHLYVRDRNLGILLYEIDEANESRLVFRDQFVALPGSDVNLGFSYALELSPDGRHLYGMRSISGPNDLFVLERNPGNGSLALVETQTVVRDVPPGFDDPVEISVSPDGLRLVVTESGTDGLVTFERDRNTGRLTHVREQRNQTGVLDGFLNPGAATFSPDGETLVVGTDAGLQVFRAGPPECPEDGQGLCLQDDRFAVTVDWERRNGATGIGQSVPFGSDDSGLLWFFAEDNWEMLVKVLDGCANNGHFWVFSAATTNVEYTLNVADRLTGLRRSYTNPQGTSAAALTDTRAFATCPVPAAAAAEAGDASTVVPAISSIFPLPEPSNASMALASGTCVADDVTLCLNENRFKVEVAWTRANGVTGVGSVVPFGSDDSGLLWFFNGANWEMLIKVLDGCANNGHYWVFSAATTNVEYTLRVTDTVTGTMKEYFNPQGNRASAITDTRAFETCN